MPIKRKKFYKNKYFVSILLFLIVFLFFFAVIPIIKIRSKGQILIKSAKQLKASFSRNDIDLLDKDLITFSKQYEALRNDAKMLYWSSFIPYGADFKNKIEAGKYAIMAAETTVKAIKPYADLIGFKKGESSFIEKSSEDRLQTAILTLDKILTKYDDVSSNLKKA